MPNNTCDGVGKPPKVFFWVGRGRSGQPAALVGSLKWQGNAQLVLSSVMYKVLEKKSG